LFHNQERAWSKILDFVWWQKGYRPIDWWWCYNGKCF
jgi:hypothetical protein